MDAFDPVWRLCVYFSALIFSSFIGFLAGGGIFLATADKCSALVGGVGLFSMLILYFFQEPNDRPRT